MHDPVIHFFNSCSCGSVHIESDVYPRLHQAIDHYRALTAERKLLLSENLVFLAENQALKHECEKLRLQVRELQDEIVQFLGECGYETGVTP
jgi:hypothetical protein